MKCFDTGILQAYIDGELSPKMMERVMTHLDTCEACQSQFDELLEMNEWEGTLEDQEAQCITLHVQSAWNKVEDKLEQKNIINRIKGALREMNKMKKFAGVAVASLLVLTGVPVIASGVYNLFTEHVLEDKVVNEGMINEDGTVVDATKGGEFQALDEKITDKGITLHLTESYVADSRVSVHYRIEDEKGNLIPVEYDTEGLDLKYDGKVDGKQVDAPEYYEDREKGIFSQLQFLASEDNLPFELIKDNKSLEIGIRELGNKNEGTITFAGVNPIKYPVSLDVNISKIGKTAGSWKGQIELKGN